MNNLENLYEKKFYYEDPEEEKHISQRGFLKKKLERNMITGLLQQSNKKYFCFHLKGRYLCYYESEPVIIIRDPKTSPPTSLMSGILKTLRIITITSSVIFL
jgi:hypothetical protein